MLTNINFFLFQILCKKSTFFPSEMSSDDKLNTKIDLLLPDFGKLFYEQKSEFVFCKPHLMPLKTITLEKLERMQKEAHAQLQETRSKTAEKF